MLLEIWENLGQEYKEAPQIAINRIHGILDMYIIEKRAKIMNLLDTDRNFDIEISWDDWNLKIKLLHKNNKTQFIINDLLPKWYRIISSDTFKVNYDTKVIHINTSQKNYRWFLLTILHEIWHSLENPPDLIETVKLYFKVIFNWLIGKVDFDFEEKIIKSERFAWSYSLKMAKKLEKIWFNLISSFNSKKDLIEYVWLFLETYELGLFLNILHENKWNITKLKERLKHRPSYAKKSKNRFNWIIN